MSTGASRVAAALGDPDATGERDEWLQLAHHCQSLINTLTAVQDTAIAEAARRESVWSEDGTLGESVRGPGRVALDAADVVAPVIGASHSQAQRRVEQAVRLAAGRVPLEADDPDLPAPSGLGGLHDAMTAGHLDGYRATVIAFELEVAPADVADAIVCALGRHLGDDAATLRKRTRSLLLRISPDLVRERAKRARASTGLRRWVAEPGVDEWHGTFPSEDAATAWAAIDELAHELVADGTCSNIEQARGKALTDLVTGNASVDVQIVLTVPADGGPAPRSRPVTQTTVDLHPSASTGGGHPPGTPLAGAGGSAAVRTGANAPNPTHLHLLSDQALAQPLAVTRSDGDLTHGPPPPPATATASDGHLTDGPPPPPATATASDDDLLAVQGSRPSEPLLMRRGWLRDHLRQEPPKSRRATGQDRPSMVSCDPLTGARLDPGDDLATDAYRPGTKLAALVEARDGGCRFPGCSVAARFCDLDHVQPWPTGPTTAASLLTLCRHHHRIKQLPGWRLRLAPDGSTSWTDPTGRIRTTAPLDALTAVVLTADGVPHPPATAPAVEVITSAAWSALETHLGFSLEHQPHRDREQRWWLPVTHRRCTSSVDLRTGAARCQALALPDTPPF